MNCKYYNDFLLNCDKNRLCPASGVVQSCYFCDEGLQKECKKRGVICKEIVKLKGVKQ